jgi:hypothetical protein
LDEVAKVGEPMKELTEEEIEAMKKGKAAGPSGVTGELIRKGE